MRRGPGGGGAGGPAGEGLPGFAPRLDEERAEAALSTVRLLLGPGGADGGQDA